MNNLPPHDAPAERAVIGAILRDSETFPAVRALLSDSTFYLSQHQRIFAAMTAVADSQAPVDLVTVASELNKRGHIADIGGNVYLAELYQDVATGANAEYYASAIRDCSTIRDLIHTTNMILRDAYEHRMPAEELLASAERSIFAIGEDRQQTKETARPIAEVLREVMSRIDDRIGSGRTLSGISSGYDDLDEILGGFRPGELVVIGARPSIGKTAIALNIASRVAEAGLPVFFASLEMPKSELGGRLLSMGSGVPMHHISRAVGLTGDEIGRIAAAAGPNGIGGCSLFVDDMPDQLPARIASVCRRLVRRNGVKMVVVDYLQLMRPENHRDNRSQQVGMLALRMKHMARDCNVPVILLSQLNRDSENGSRRPRLSDLRESGDIEAHADRVLLLHREANLNMADPSWPIDVIVAKNRNGPTGDVRLLYQRQVMRFENTAK